jgi:AraC-like DNA-binding protein
VCNIDWYQSISERSRCTDIAQGGTDPSHWISELLSSLEDIPSDLCQRDFALARGILATHAARAAFALQCLERPEVANAYAGVAVSNTDFELRKAVHLSARVLALASGVLPPGRDKHGVLHHVRTAVGLIEQQACEPHINLRIVAHQVGLSPWHLSRLLNRAGYGFAQCLHRERIWRAGALLRTSMSVKEVAAAVGYANTTQFDRRFRVYHHMTPTEYREFWCASHVEGADAAVAIGLDVAS